jgi:hypothetical protein
MYSVWSDYWFLWYFTWYFTSSTKGMKTEHFSASWCCYYIYAHSKVCTGLVIEFWRLLLDEMCWDCAVSVGMQWENGTVTWHLFQSHINFDVCLHICFLETRIFCTYIMSTWKHVLPTYYIQASSSCTAFHAAFIIINDPFFFRRKKNSFTHLPQSHTCEEYVIFTLIFVRIFLKNF